MGIRQSPFLDTAVPAIPEQQHGTCQKGRCTRCRPGCASCSCRKNLAGPAAGLQPMHK